MKNIKRGCVNCHYWQAATNSCSAPIPASVWFHTGHRKVFFNSGADCKAHRMRSTRRVAVEVVT